MSHTDRYIFEPRREPFSGNGSLGITDTTTDAMIRVHIKDGMWAVEVKDHALITDLPQSAQDAIKKLGESTAQALYNAACEAYWDWAGEAATEYGFPTAYSAGRSGGWLAVDGTQDWEPAELLQPSDDFLKQREAFLTFAFEAVGMIDHFRNEYVENLDTAAQAPEQVQHSSEPIRVLAVMWDDESGPNCDLYRNKPVLLGALGTHYEGVVNDALNHPGKGFHAAGATGTVRYLTVRDA